MSIATMYAITNYEKCVQENPAEEHYKNRLEDMNRIQKILINKLGE